MSTRIEAAARAYRAKVEWIDRHSRDDYGREDELGMEAALEAADAMMFSGASIERAARVLMWRIDDLTPPEAMDHARAVITALRDAPHATGGANEAGEAPVDTGDATGAENGA